MYTVNRQLICGGRLAPKVWCTFLNPIGWGARHHLGLKITFQFDNDVFSFNSARHLVLVIHPVTGEHIKVALSQSKLLQVWTFCRIPWMLTKQVGSPSALEILGHWVDAEACTVTLVEEKKRDFAAEVKTFLSTLAPPLIDWWPIEGYAQWARYSNLFAKFALKALYGKTSNKSRHDAPVHIDKEAKANLRWFITGILAAPPSTSLTPRSTDGLVRKQMQSNTWMPASPVTTSAQG